MTDFTKGGRGKKPPYDTTHHRIPEPCKNTVKLLSDTWKHLLSDEEGETKAQKLLTDIEDLTTVHYTQAFDKPVNNFTKTPKPGNELLDLLKEAAAIDGRRVAEMRKKINEAIQFLEQEID